MKKQRKPRKFENVDVMASLKSIMKQNTAYFQGDLEYDKKFIQECAKSSNTDDKVLLWLSRESGTVSLRERDVFVNGTNANKLWRYYAEADFDYFLTYAVELCGIKNGRVMGNLYELDYIEHYKRVKSGAVSSQKTLLVYEHGVKGAPSVPYFDGDPDPELGKFKYFKSQPDDPEALKSLLLEEARRRSMLNPGVLEEHIAILHGEMIEREAWRIVKKFKKIPKPNRPDGEGFVVELSGAFLRLASAADMKHLRLILPYQTLSFVHGDKQSRRVYAAIGKDEKRDIRIPKRYQ